MDYGALGVVNIGYLCSSKQFLSYTISSAMQLLFDFHTMLIVVLLNFLHFSEAEIYHVTQLKQNSYGYLCNSKQFFYVQSQVQCRLLFDLVLLQY